MRAVTAATLGALLLQACAGDSASEDMSAPSWSVDPVPEVTIGVTEGAAPYLFDVVAGAVLLPDGRIVVADRGHAVLRVFDADGGFLDEMGGSGEGPGEFRYINTLAMHDPDTLVVYDPRDYRLTRYLADGTLVGTVQIRGEGGFPEVFLGRFGNGDLAFAWIVGEAPPPGSVRADGMEMGRFDSTGRFIRLLGKTTGMWRWEAGMYPFSPRYHGFTAGDSVYFTDGLRPVLRIVDAEGGDAGAIPLHPAPAWATDPWTALQDELEERENQNAIDLLQRAPRDSVPATAVVLRDSEGRVWAKRYEPATDSNWLGHFTFRGGGEWWVLEPTGETLARVDVPPGLIILDARGEQVLGMTVDELGVQRIVRHRVRGVGG